MSIVRRALFLSTADRYVALVCNFATVAIVSRILTPEEIGVSVIGMAFVGMVYSLREFASANFLYQQPNLSRAEIRGAFTVMLICSVLIALALAISASLVARQYGEPRLTSYFRVIAVGIVLEMASVPIITLLRREMAFVKVTVINISGTAVNAVVTLGLAVAGFSYMSFAWAWLATAAVTGVLALGLSRDFWILRPSLKGWRGMLAFGGYNGLTVVLYRAYDAVPYLLLGRMLSLDAAALYSRAQMICQVPDKIFLSGAVTVILPAFAAEAREGRGLKEPYLKALSLITVLQWPALLVLAVLAYPAVDLLLGHQWEAASPIVQIVALSALFAFSFELNYPVLVAVGAAQDIMRRALIIFPISAIILAAATFFGLMAVALSLLLAIPFQAIVSLQFIKRHIDVAWLDILYAVGKSLAVAAAAALGPLAIVINSGSFDISIGRGLLAGSLAALGWIGGVTLTRHPILAEIVEIFPGLRGTTTERWLTGEARA